jgi:winged helix-turn-helix protein/methyltransferase family protein
MSSSSASTTSSPIDNVKLQQFMEKILSDFGGAASCVLGYIGDKLGLYKAMSDFVRPITSQELANLTATAERYIREWLANQAAGGYLTYDSASQRYTLPYEHAQALVNENQAAGGYLTYDSASQRYTLPYEHAQALVNENSPAYVAGGFQVMMSFYLDASKILEVFKTGKGIAWGDHDKDLYQGTERFFRPGYTTNLVSSWIPALDNGKIEQRLKQEGGLKVADIGCGHGISTILMAKAYPNSKFYGFDNHSASIEHARNKAREEGLGEERIEFEIASSTNFPFPTEGTDGSSNNEDKQKK